MNALVPRDRRTSCRCWNGEQPGDKEDLAGEPFVGPAGALLHRALDAAGIDRTRVYLTNAVKHFKWERSGKVRLHKKPNAGEIRACRHWLDEELRIVAPRVVILLGATAGQAFFGPSFRLTRSRGKVIESRGGEPTVATVHPSAVLRAGPRREDAYAGLVADLRFARGVVEHPRPDD